MRRLLHFNPTLGWMLVTQLAYLILGEAVILVFVPDKLVWAVCFLAGVLFSAVASIHMCYVIEQAVYMDQRGAQNKSIGGSMIRALLFMAVLVLCALWSEQGLFAALIGTLALKLSAYLAPITDKVLQKILKKGR